MSDMFLGSQAPLYQNVRICRRNENGKILEERYAKNRVTRLMLYGIGKFLLGHFNDSTPDKIYEFIPRYLALGTNTPGLDANSAGVTTVSSVNDTRLLNEIKQSSTTGTSETVKRVWIAERNMCKLNTKFSDPFIKVSIKTYISSSHYDGMSIGEAGLFSKEQDNNCLARVCFSPIIKNPGEVLDVQWDITLLSYGETKYPEKLEIENGSKISIPLKYTNKHFIEIDLGLKRYWSTSSLGNDDNSELFSINNDGIISSNYTLDELKSSTWYNYLSGISIGNNKYLSDNFENIVELLKDSKLNDSTNDGQNAKFLYSINQSIPNIFHFGNLYYNQNVNQIDTDSLAATLLFSEDKTYSDEDTNGRYLETNTPGTYTIITSNNNDSKYKVVKNQFYKKNEIDNTKWDALNYFMYNGSIVDVDNNPTEYTYRDGIFYKTETIINDIFVNEYLNFSNNTDDKFYIYSIDIYNTIQYFGYKIDLNNDCEIYLNDEDTTYHLSNDNYWVTGDYIKLIPIITPTNATDKSLTWVIQNKDIAKINWDGVVTAWNLGETTAITSTSNDLRAKCIIDVVKDTSYIDIDNITISPEEITLVIDGDANQFVIVSAEIEPLFATNATVTWNLSYEISNSVSIINLGNNQVKLVLSGNGTIGAGYLTATSQSGKSASCLVRIIYKSDNDDCDCPDPSHLLQKG